MIFSLRGYHYILYSLPVHVSNPHGDRQNWAGIEGTLIIIKKCTKFHLRKAHGLGSFHSDRPQPRVFRRIGRVESCFALKSTKSIDLHLVQGFCEWARKDESQYVIHYPRYFCRMQFSNLQDTKRRSMSIFTKTSSK